MPVGNADEMTSVNMLLEYSASVFALTEKLRRKDLSGSLDDHRKRIMKAFEVLERMAYERQFSTSVIQDTRYALAAYVDEVVLTSDNPERMNWMSKPLQLKYFGEHLAGENFFVKLNKLRQGGEKNIDLLEVYYACLQLGFEGMYKMRGLEALMALQVDLRSQIDGYRGLVDPKLAPDGTPKTGIIARVSRHIPYWVIGVVTAGILFFSYVGYSVLLAELVNESVASLEGEYVTLSRPSRPIEPVRRRVGD